jgi:hypothetical protein
VVMFGVDLTISTDAATTDANITFSGLIDGAHALTLTTGSGNATVQGTSRSFDGSDDYVDVGTSSTLLPSNITVSFWAKGNATPAQYDSFMGKTNGAGWTQGWGFYFNSATELDFFIQTWNANRAYATVTPSNWNHIVGTWDGSTVKLYVNGVLGTTASYSGSITGSGNPFEIGRLGSNSYNLNSNIANVQIYNRALNTTEIGQIKASPYSVTSGLIGYWPMLGGPSELDRSGQGNTGTYTNGPTSSTTYPTGVVTAGNITPLSSHTVTGAAITLAGVTTTGAQSYTGTGTVTLNGPLTTNSNGNITVSGAGALTASGAISANGT